MQQAGTGAGGFVAYRIQAEAGHHAHFLVQWQHLAQQRVLRIAMAHAGHETAWHAQRELGVGLY